MTSPDMSTSWMGILCALVVVMGFSLVWRDTADEPSVLQEICKRIVLPRILVWNWVKMTETRVWNLIVLSGWTTKQYLTSSRSFIFIFLKNSLKIVVVKIVMTHLPLFFMRWLQFSFWTPFRAEINVCNVNQAISKKYLQKTNYSAPGKPLFADWPK